MIKTVPSDSVRRRLATTMHGQNGSLLLGAACGLAAMWASALLTGWQEITWLAVAFSAAAVVRLALAAFIHARPENLTGRVVNLLFPVVAFLNAGLIGLVAGTVILRSAPADVQVLATSHLLGFAGGIAARNAGRPLVAIGQLVIVTLPLMVASFVAGTPAMLVLAILAPGFIVGMSATTVTVFRHLSDQMTAIDESRIHARELHVQARTDSVTGLANRAGFNHELEALVGKLLPGQRLSLVWLDLQRFKEINDTLGHTMGDKVLAEVARRLRQIAPDDSVLARFAGDEFLIATVLHKREQAEDIAAAISETLARPMRVGGERVECGASIGVALIPDDAGNVEKLLQSADLALFHAKTQGANRVCFFDASMTRALARKKEIEDELRSAIQKDELSIFFQPIIDLETGRIRSFEALVRWFHPDKGELFPDEFIPVAEDTGLIITLGNWITTHAARTAATWPEDVTLAVNLSPVQIKAPGAALGILAALREARLNPARLELEVTESLFLEDDTHTQAFMADLAREGVRFALDDFGTGYSSLQYINHHPFCTIKVDRSFVSGPKTGKRTDAIIRAVAEMGATLDMEIVAEGLETIEQVHSVKQAGCTLGQGYYFSRAVPDYLAAMLLSQERQREDEQGIFPDARIVV